MYAVLDPKIRLFIFHRLQKELANLSNLDEIEIKRIIISILKSIFIENEILIENKKLFILIHQKKIPIPLEKWIDDIKILWTNYHQFLDNT